MLLLCHSERNCLQVSLGCKELINKPINIAAVADENVPRPALCPVKAQLEGHRPVVCVFEEHHKSVPLSKDRSALWIKEVIMQAYCYPLSSTKKSVTFTFVKR